ncbi:MAG: hypothetical protein ACP5NV_03545 [Candidatus Woesearchaeota archaeon]
MTNKQNKTIDLCVGLSPIPIIVSTPTKEEYTQLMQVLELGGAIWSSGLCPTSKLERWDKYKKDTAVVMPDPHDILPIVMYDYINLSRHYGVVLSPKEFYEKQDISELQLKNIRNYFESNQ